MLRIDRLHHQQFRAPRNQIRVKQRLLLMTTKMSTWKRCGTSSKKRKMLRPSHQTLEPTNDHDHPMCSSTRETLKSSEARRRKKVLKWLKSWYVTHSHRRITVRNLNVRVEGTRRIIGLWSCQVMSLSLKVISLLRRTKSSSKQDL